MEGERRVTREIEVYNLDAGIAVGYQVNSMKATHFRIWATNTLREFIVKGFVLNDQMLKNGRSFYNYSKIGIHPYIAFNWVSLREIRDERWVPFLLIIHSHQLLGSSMNGFRDQERCDQLLLISILDSRWFYKG